MSSKELDSQIESKMRAAGIPWPTINAFLNNVHKALAGDVGCVSESAIESIPSLPRMEELPSAEVSDAALLSQLAMIRPNGGLGTGMGLERAKSLMVVKGSESFLDFIAKQVLQLRERTGKSTPEFHLMNSVTTRPDTLAYLRRYPTLPTEGTLDFLQYQAPKLEAETLEPIRWPKEPVLEWCPQGHGDIYPSMEAAGLIDQMLRRGIRFLFLSNADNLGATADPALLRYFASSGLAFLMEVADRTPADRKGGHLARRRESGRLLLRESAQCPEDEQPSFQDIARHRFFNTNNLWVRLDRLKEELVRNEGMLPLPLIRNAKTVDPRDPRSPRVLQLETAMGAAIEYFPDAGAIVVPRGRFAPVKTTADLLALRSDAYEITGDYRLVLAPLRQGRPPLIDLDHSHYRVMADFDRWFAQSVPSLAECDSLKIAGPLIFPPGVKCRGTVEFVNASTEPKSVAPGFYRDERVTVK